MIWQYRKGPVFSTLNNAINYFQTSFNRIIVIKYENIAGYNEASNIQSHLQIIHPADIPWAFPSDALRCRILVHVPAEYWCQLRYT